MPERHVEHNHRCTLDIRSSEFPYLNRKLLLVFADKTLYLLYLKYMCLMLIKIKGRIGVPRLNIFTDKKESLVRMF